MQSEILNVNKCYRLNHEVLQLEVPLQLSVLLNTLLKLSPSGLACKWEVLAISKLNLCFLWRSSRWKCWKMEDLGHLNLESPNNALWVTETQRSIISFWYGKFMDPISFAFIKYINKEWDWNAYLLIRWKQIFEYAYNIEWIIRDV